MGMTKKALVEYVRMTEHNQEVAEEALNQQAENVKDWRPVKHGRWLNWKGEPFQADDFGWDWTCSECKNTLTFEEPVTAEEFASNFCPNCGADMRGEEDGK